jgi:hypothetical protein
MLDDSAGLPAFSRGVQKVKWGKEEDQRLLDAVAKYGASSWTKVAALVTGRTSKQCRERWLGQLSPYVHKTTWTVEEDAMLFHGHSLYGNQWTAIAQFLPGRSAICVKNRWNWLSHRRISGVAQLWLVPRPPAMMAVTEITQQPNKPKTILLEPLPPAEDLFGDRFKEFQAQMLGHSTGFHQ